MGRALSPGALPVGIFLLVAVASGGCASHGALTPTERACETTSPTQGPDPGYRVVVDPSEGAGSVVFPTADSSWTLSYRFAVPPLPCSPSWNHTDQVFYVWGDLDWDVYGARGAHPLSHYRYNQIVPQATIGHVLDGNDAGYHPTWDRYAGWIIQAQYFWMDDDGTPYAQAGEVVPVSPGEEVTTRIAYDADAGTLTASIGTESAVSSIVSERPFPNESPALFTSWRDFLERAAAASGDLFGRPMLNVETHRVDEPTICSVLPFQVGSVGLPGGVVSGAQVDVRRVGDFTCGRPLAQLGF